MWLTFFGCFWNSDPFQAERAARSSLSIATAPSSLPSSTASSPSPVPATGWNPFHLVNVFLDIWMWWSSLKPMFYRPPCHMGIFIDVTFCCRLHVLNCATHSRHIRQNVNPHSGGSTILSLSASWLWTMDICCQRISNPCLNQGLIDKWSGRKENASLSTAKGWKEETYWGGAQL